MMISDNNKRVIKNTFSLYVRTVLLTMVSLYTARVVLNALGDNDYGLYNVVGGVVTMLGFMVGTMSNASQRFFAMDLSLNRWEKINKTYSVILVLFFGFIIVLLFISETVGLWFVVYKLNIPNGRKVAAIIVYETSVLSFIMSIVSTPYIALLTADENLSVYSFISVIEAFIKLFLLCMLPYVSIDKLVAYAFIMMSVSGIINVIYILYTKKRYPKLNFEIYKDKSDYINMYSYQGWNLIGSVASVLKCQGINVVINLFFGTAINAARGISVQVNSAVSSFGVNFMRAVNPQIIKAYGTDDHDRFNNLMISASKLSCFLLMIVSTPVLFDTDFILKLWLKDVPDYTVPFVRLALLDAIASELTSSISTGVQAVGKIKVYQVVVGGILLLNVPVSYLCLKICSKPEIPFMVAIIISLLCNVARIICIKKLYYKFSMLDYFIKVLLPISATTILTYFAVKGMLNEAQSVYVLFQNIVISVFICSGVIMGIGLNRQERQVLFQYVSKCFVKKG